MIVIHFGPSYIRATGHANAAKSGSDIVCAAVSAIIQSCSAWFNLNEIETFVEPSVPIYQIKLLSETRDNKNKLQLAQKQLQAIQENYPKYIKIEK